MEAAADWVGQSHLKVTGSSRSEVRTLGLAKEALSYLLDHFLESTVISSLGEKACREAAAYSGPFISASKHEASILGSAQVGVYGGGPYLTFDLRSQLELDLAGWLG